MMSKNSNYLIIVGVGVLLSLTGCTSQVNNRGPLHNTYFIVKGEPASKIELCKSDEIEQSL